MKPYTDIDGLQDIVLEESYVPGITATRGKLVFKVDFLLTTDHPLYQPHGPETIGCFRREELRFQTVKSLQWSDQGASPAQDATVELDYDHIDWFEWKPGLLSPRRYLGIHRGERRQRPGHHRRHWQPRVSPESQAAMGLPLRVRQQRPER